MSILSKAMDFLIKHWAPYTRRFPSALPVVSTSFIAGKPLWVRHAFSTCNFSLILRGGGRFRRAGRVWTVTAPCVLTQWPGEFVEYGPADGHRTWDECYVIYDARTRPALERNGFLRADLPVWPMADPARVRALLRDLLPLTNRPDPEHAADHMDRVWEHILLATLSAPAPSAGTANPLELTLAGLRDDPGQPVDFAALARNAGMSVSTFRREWARQFQTPPARTLLALRMRAACQQLATTDEAIKRVAAAVGYADEFHFSRRFRAHTGLAPSAYRQRFRLDPAAPEGR